MLLIPLLLPVAQDLTDESLSEWIARIVPGEQEMRWRQAGWRPTLWEGLIDAHKEKKPILLWAMNGHPLGLC